jgi:hypothetical protein
MEAQSIDLYQDVSGEDATLTGTVRPSRRRGKAGLAKGSLSVLSSPEPSGQAKTKAVRAFLDRLRVPGYHQVGGLGACTLISRAALKAGCHFGEIEGLHMLGEDRHFSVRAQALGFSLYADSHAPPRHLYRLDELGRSPEPPPQAPGDDGLIGGVLRFDPPSSAPGSVRTAPLRDAPACRRESLPPIFLRRSRGGRILLLMVVRDEAGRYLERVLRRAALEVDDVLVVDDASTDGTADLCASILDDLAIAGEVVRRAESLFAQEWRSRLDAWRLALARGPEWILVLDGDELLDAPARALRGHVDQGRYDAVGFRLFDMWDEHHYRDDALWCAHTRAWPLLVRVDPTEGVEWSRKDLHCGRVPLAVARRPRHRLLHSGFRVQHLGWMTEADRRAKSERYSMRDPDGRWGDRAQYASILDPAPRLTRWEPRGSAPPGSAQGGEHGTVA